MTTSPKPTPLSEHEKTMRSLNFWNHVMTCVVVAMAIPIVGMFARFIFWPLIVAVFTGRCGDKPCQM